MLVSSIRLAGRYPDFARRYESDAVARESSQLLIQMENTPTETVQFPHKHALEFMLSGISHQPIQRWPTGSGSAKSCIYIFTEHFPVPAAEHSRNSRSCLSQF